MALNLRVTYPATDGSMPESVELEWSELPPGEVVMSVLVALVSAPAERSEDRRSSFLGAGRITHDASKGDILVMCWDGCVRNAGDLLASGRVDLAGPAGEDLRTGDMVEIRWGKWQRQETA